MAPAHFVRVCVAEARKVFTRGSGVACLAVSLLVGLGAVVAMWQVQNIGDGASMNGQPLSALVTYSGIATGAWGLWARNFFVLPMFLLLATASAFAGEQADQTLRECLVRPVARPAVLAAKSVALGGLSACTLLLTLVPALGLGLVLYGLPAETAVPARETVGNLLLGYGASFLSDLGLIAVGLLVSSFIRSAGGVAIAVVFVLLADRALWLALKLLGMVGLESAQALTSWTLVNALSCWEGWQTEWESGRFVALAIVAGAAWGGTVTRFSRMDVP
jgi:hypothetical protein